MLGHARRSSPVQQNLRPRHRERLGFYATDQEREPNGIRFIPMALEITP
jgi:hypothetical protein